MIANLEEGKIKEICSSRKLLEFPTYPFLTDREYRDFFGYDVAQSTEVLNRLYAGACGSCIEDIFRAGWRLKDKDDNKGGHCCTSIDCEFYSSKFDGCPIYEFRPAECRVTYCRDVFKHFPNISKEETTAFELLDSVHSYLPKVRSAKQRALPDRLLDKAEETTKQFENGKIDNLEAKRILGDIIKEYRTHNRFVYVPLGRNTRFVVLDNVWKE